MSYGIEFALVRAVVPLEWETLAHDEEWPLDFDIRVRLVPHWGLHRLWLYHDRDEESWTLRGRPWQRMTAQGELKTLRVTSTFAEILDYMRSNSFRRAFYLPDISDE